MAIPGVGGTTVTTTSTVDDAARQAAVDSALDDLGVNSFDFEGETIDLFELGSAGELNEWRAPFADKIKDLMNQQPPLSPEQIQAEAAKVVEDFKGEAVFMMSFIVGEFMLSSLVADQVQALMGFDASW